MARAAGGDDGNKGRLRWMLGGGCYDIRRVAAGSPGSSTRAHWGRPRGGERYMFTSPRLGGRY